MMQITISVGILYVALPICIILCATIWYRWLKQTEFIRRLVGPHNQQLKHMSYGRLLLKTLLITLALLGFLWACIRPTVPTEPSEHEEALRDVLIALDVSRSMLAQDVEPSRLEYAKKLIITTVKKVSADRVGLILFCNSAFVYCPFTRDKELFMQFVDSIDHHAVTAGATSLEAAFTKAFELCERYEHKEKLLLLITDGEDTRHSYDEIKNKAHSLRMTIITVGIGTEQGAPIPTYDLSGTITGHVIDAKGAIVISKLAPKLLSDIASVTGGYYVSLSRESDIRRVNALIKQNEKNTIVAFKQQHELFFIGTIIAVISLLVEWIL